MKYDYDNNGNLPVKTELEKAASASVNLAARGVLATTSYDALGRAMQSPQQMGADSYVTKYQSNLADRVTEVEYPSSTASNPKKVGYGYSASEHCKVREGQSPVA